MINVKMCRLICLCFFVSSCTEQNNENDFQQKSAIGKAANDSLHDVLKTGYHFRPDEFGWRARFAKDYDTITSNGDFLRYEADSSSYDLLVHWGNKYGEIGVFRTGIYPGDRTNEYSTESKNYIALHVACGSPCWKLTLLPLNPGDRIREYDFDLGFDTVNNYVFYQESGNEFEIVDLLTGQKEKIVLDGLPFDAYMINDVEKVSFGKNKLFVRWKISEEKSRQKFFQIKFD